MLSLTLRPCAPRRKHRWNGEWVFDTHGAALQRALGTNTVTLLASPATLLRSDLSLAPSALAKLQPPAFGGEKLTQRERIKRTAGMVGSNMDQGAIERDAEEAAAASKA